MLGRLALAWRHASAKRNRFDYFGENGCLTLSFFAVISDSFGSPVIAHLIAILVAS
jgi:hypothetical protein